MTSRGRAALVLALVAFFVARLFGSKPLYPVAVGLLLAVLVGWLWVRLSTGPARLRRTAGTGDQYEGDDLWVEMRLEGGGSVPPPPVTLVERIGKLGELPTPLRRWYGFLVGSYILPSVPRGRYVVSDSRAVIEDPFGFARTEIPVPTPGALLVYPRLVVLDRLFADGGAGATDGRRLVLRRPTGFDFHSVREYEHGESLRRVHWPSTAKRGELMVKELEDAPRDEVAVVLDADARVVIGGSFDTQVRAAGSILDAHVRRGRRCVLVVNNAGRDGQRVHSLDGDRRLALDLLAAAEPDGRTALAALIADESGPAARSAELTVVTASSAPELVDALIRRVAGRRRAAVVFVDASSFAVAGASPQPVPGLLRLQAAGLPVAVLRAGDDLRAVLSGSELGAVADA